MVRGFAAGDIDTSKPHPARMYAVRFLAGEAGIRQFIDVGTGIPITMHQV